MNSANAFAYACSGAMNESDVRNYAQYVQLNNERVSRLGGWFAEQAKKTFDRFNDFVDSRAWELSKRLSGNNYGDYVGRFEVGYLGSLEGQQNAEGFMRDYIMANPDVMKLFGDEVIEGYGGDFSKHCRGIGRDNPFYRKAMNGVVNLRKEGEVSKADISHFNDSALNGLPIRSIFDIQRTWHATRHHIAKNLFDPTSPDNKRMSTAPEETE